MLSYSGSITEPTGLTMHVIFTSQKQDNLIKHANVYKCSFHVTYLHLVQYVINGLKFVLEHGHTCSLGSVYMQVQLSKML